MAAVEANPNGRATAHAPFITPAALRPRADIRTLGWYSATATAGQPFYSPWTYDADATTYISSGSYIRRCPLTTSCVMYTACSSGFMVAVGTSVYCGVGASSGSATNYCSSHLLLPSLSAPSSTLSWIWCDSAPLTGMVFYAQQPAQPTRTSTSRSQTSSSSTSSASTPTAITTPSPERSRQPIAAIAGGAAGGIAIIGLILGIIIWIKRRDKRKTASSGPYSGYQGVALQSPYTPNFPPSGFGSAYQDNEAKPQPFVQSGLIQEASFATGPYNLRGSQQYGMALTPQELSGETALRPTELPTERPEYHVRT